MKSYTDLEQSLKLAEILPLESADMWYSYYGNSKYNPTIAYKGQQWFLCQIRNSLHDDIPCWSLSALLDNIPQVKLDSIIQSNEKLWRCLSYFKSEWNESIWCNNPVDACYEMIIKLNEQKLL